MSVHSSTLAWRIPWTEEPGRLWSTGLQRVGHDWSNLAHMHAFPKTTTVWDTRGWDFNLWILGGARKWLPTPVFLPGESRGQRSLEGYSPWGHNKGVGHDLVSKQWQQFNPEHSISPQIPEYLYVPYVTTPVFLPGESRGQRSLEGYSPWGHNKGVGHDLVSKQWQQFNP